MRGKLTLIESKRPPVFGTDPIEVEFTIKPKIGEAFLFTSPQYGFCNTSEVKVAAVDSETGAYLITTRNSLYRLEILSDPRERLVKALENEAEGIRNGWVPDISRNWGALVLESLAFLVKDR